MRNRIRILLVEHQTLIRVGVRTILSSHEEFEIVAEADSGAKGFELFRQTKPDAVILSLRLPDSCAVDAVGEYLALYPKTKILILADNTGDVEISESLKTGALGFVCKDATAEELLAAIRAVGAGQKYIPNNIATILSEHLGQEDLTAAEKGILKIVVAGKSNKEIARELNISENTVKTHVKNIFDKLGVNDRTSATTSAIRRGFVRFDK